MTPPLPTAAAPKERYQLLDLMRGMAAIAILIYHAEKYLGVQLLPNAYLAVDLFFLLSGFVIAHNYDGKFTAGMSVTNFMVQRLIRLYPCFLLAFLFGFALMAARTTRDMGGHFDAWRQLGTGALNVFFIPSYIDPHYFYEQIFPYNGAQWSLTFELLANLVYWLVFPYLTGRRLLALIVVAAIADAVTVGFLHGLDVGMRPADFWSGVPRVMLPFFMGVGIRRYVSDRFSLQLNSPAIFGSILLLGVAFSLSRFIPVPLLPAVEFITVAVLFPALLVAVCRTVPTLRVAQLCKLTGDASYPVYLLQVSFFLLFAALPELLLHMKAKDFMPYIGIAFIVTTFVCAVWVDRYYELPVRNRLKNAWRSYLKNKSAKSVATAERQLAKAK